MSRTRNCKSLPQYQSVGKIKTESLSKRKAKTLMGNVIFIGLHVTTSNILREKTLKSIAYHS